MSGLAIKRPVARICKILASDTFHQKPPLAGADSNQQAGDLFAGLKASGAEDAFSSWLRDEKPVRIEWSTFGIAALESSQPVPKRPAHRPDFSGN
jgi:hypothetical protein